MPTTEEPWGPYVFLAEGEPAPCWRCDTPTRLVEINWAAHLCSEACDREAMDEFEQAVRGLAPPSTFD